MEEEYKSYSNKSKEAAKEAAKEEKKLPEKKIEKVTTGTVTVQKKSGAKKFFDNFVAGDAENIKNYVIKDVMIPSAKKAITDVVGSISDTLGDIVKNIFDMALYGEANHSRRNKAGSKVNYNGAFLNSNKDTNRVSVLNKTTGFDYDDLIFDTRGDAETVLSAMDDVIERYSVVSVADMYDLAEVSCPTYTANKYGWTNTRNASVIRSGGGYIIKMPKASPIE